jgi:hypothetical protein
MVALAALAMVASGCGSSSKSSTAKSATPQLTFHGWNFDLKQSNNGGLRRAGTRNGGRLQFVQHCTARVARLLAVHTAQGLTGKAVSLRLRYVSPQAQSKTLYSGTTQIRDGQKAFIFAPPSSRGFTGDGRFIAQALLGSQSLGSDVLLIKTRGNCVRKRAAAGLLVPPR